ncbi:hypothetical protein ACO1KQ_14535, partial [Staphylococcus aureus]
MIQGEYQIEAGGLAQPDGDTNNNGIPDATEITKRVIAAQKVLSEERRANAEIASREKIHNDQMNLAHKEMDLKKEELKT